MPQEIIRDISIGKNQAVGTIVFNNTKTAKSLYVDELGNAITFSKLPNLKITLINAGAQNAFKQGDIKQGNLFVGIVIGFGSSVTLTVNYEATER